MKVAIAIILLCCSALAQMPLGGITSSGVTAQALVIPIPVGKPSTTARFSQWNIGNTATEANAQLGFPVSGTITAMYCSSGAAPGGNNTFTLRKAGASTAAVVTIGNGVHQANITGLSIAMTEGDLVGIDMTAFATTVDTGCMVRVEGVALGVAVIPFGTIGSSVTTGTTRMFSLGGVFNGATGAAVPSPVGGTLSALYVGSDVTAGASQVVTFCDITNSATCVSTGVIGTCTMSGKNTACTGLSGTVTQAHLINLQVNNTSGSSATFGGYAKITGATSQVSVIPFSTSGSATTIAATATDSFGLSTFSATEGNAAIQSPVSGTAAGISGVCSTTPVGSGHTFTFNSNGSATSLTFQTAGNQYGSDFAHTGSITRGQNISLTATNSNATTAANCGGYLKITGTT